MYELYLADVDDYYLFILLILVVVVLRLSVPVLIATGELYELYWFIGLMGVGDDVLLLVLVVLYYILDADFDCTSSCGVYGLCALIDDLPIALLLVVYVLVYVLVLVLVLNAAVLVEVVLPGAIFLRV